MSDFFQCIYTKPDYVSSSKEKIMNFLSSDGDEHISEIYKQHALTDDERDSLESPLSKAELHCQLFNHMKPNSSPGIDDFTVSWLKEFWSELGDLITLAVNV